MASRRALSGVLAFVSFLFSSSPAAAATYEQTIDFSNVSQDCILTRNLTGRARYFHGFHRCHPLEASWEGPFYRQNWVQPQICKPELTSCVYGENSCCWTGCGTLTHVEEHAADFNLGKKFPPGTHRQTLTVTQPVPPALQTVDQIRDATFRLAFTPGSFSAGGACASLSAGFVPGDPLMVPGDVLAVTVIIPDRDQSAELNALAGAREGPVGGLVELAFKATKRVSVAGVVQEVPFAGKQVSFSVSGPGNATFSVNPVPTGADGVARTTVILGGIAGTYSITATCAACRAKPVAQVSVEATAPVLEMAAVSAPTHAVAGLPLPEDVKVKVFVSGTETASENVGVEFRLKDAGGTVLETKQAETGPDGVAAANFTIGAAGNFTVEALCAVCGVGQTAMFPVSVTAQAPTLELVKDEVLTGGSGDGQKAFVGNFLAPMRVRIQSSGAGGSLSGVPVDFVIEPPPGAKGAWVSPETVMTNEQGQASTILTLGAQPGEYRVRARCLTCTENQETVFIATAKPLPLYFAGFPADFEEGPFITIENGAPSKMVLGDVSFTTLEVTADGQPENLVYQWGIRKGADKVEFDGSATEAKVRLRPKAVSERLGDIELVVEYGDPGNPLKSAPRTHKVTVQRPAGLRREKAETNACNRKESALPGMPKTSRGKYGALVNFQYTALDQFGQALEILPSQVGREGAIRFRERGRIKSVTHPDFHFPDWKLGAEITKEDWLDAGGRFADTIGVCYDDKDYPPGFESVFDRCVSVGGFRIQREEASYAGYDASIVTSNEPECPLP